MTDFTTVQERAAKLDAALANGELTAKEFYAIVDADEALTVYYTARALFGTPEQKS